jgi:hypothetical protein
MFENYKSEFSALLGMARRVWKSIKQIALKREKEKTIQSIINRVDTLKNQMARYS